jgi:hypothetical protein
MLHKAPFIIAPEIILSLPLSVIKKRIQQATLQPEMFF